MKPRRRHSDHLLIPTSGRLRLNLWPLVGPLLALLAWLLILGLADLIGD
jgi:hypothetical protein